MQTHGKQDNKYVGLIYCGDCGANMVRRYYYSEKNGVLYYNYYFICGNYAKISKEKYNCNRWKEEVIDELVYRALIMQLKTVCELKTQLKRFNGEYFETFQKYLNRNRVKLFSSIKGTKQDDLNYMSNMFRARLIRMHIIV